VYEVSGYNNEDIVWDGESNEGLSTGELPDGTYFYVVNLSNGSELLKGFLVLKR